MLSSHPPRPERGIYAEEVNQLANGTVRRLTFGLPARGAGRSEAALIRMPRERGFRGERWDVCRGRQCLW